MSTQVLGDVELVTKQEMEAAIEAVVIPEEAIDTKIGNKAAEIQAAIDLVEQSVDNEASLRAAGDDNLVSRLNAETELRSSTDTAIQERLSTEENTRSTADEQLTELINAEVSERAAAISQVTSQVEATNVVVTELNTRVTSNTANNTAAMTAIAAVEQRATALESSVNGITTENTTTKSTLGTAVTTIEQNTQKITAIEASITAIDARTTENANAINAISDTSQDVFEDNVIGVKFDNLKFAQITVQNTDRSISVGDILASVTGKYLPKIPVTFAMIASVEETVDSIAVTKFAHLVLRLDANGNINVINKTVLSEPATGNIDSTTLFYVTKE